MVIEPVCSSHPSINASNPPPPVTGGSISSGGKSFTSISSGITPPVGRARTWSVTSMRMFLYLPVAKVTLSTR